MNIRKYGISRKPHAYKDRKAHKQKWKKTVHVEAHPVKQECESIIKGFVYYDGSWFCPICHNGISYEHFRSICPRCGYFQRSVMMDLSPNGNVEFQK